MKALLVLALIILLIMYPPAMVAFCLLRLAGVIILRKRL